MKLARLIICLAMMQLITGCGIANLVSKKPPVFIDSSAEELRVIDSHLALMRDITKDEYQLQQQTFEGLLRDHTANLSTRATLRFALALVTPGHPNTDPGKGYIELKQILDDPMQLTASEVNLALVILKEAENTMILEARNTELSSAMSESQFTNNQNGDTNRARYQKARKDLAAAQQQINELAEQLDEARSKIDEIKQIEVLSE